MGLAGCGKFVKFTMIVTNILIFIGGISVLGVGIWTCVDKTTFVDVVGSNLYLTAAYIMIVTGSIIALISFLGCLGAWTENKCLLVTYFIILLLIFVVLLVAGILGYVFKGEVGVEVRNTMIANMKKNMKENPKLKELFDRVQIEFKCCGINPTDQGEALNGQNSYKSWENTVNYNSDNKQIPESCCDKVLANKGGTTTCASAADRYAFKRDCYDAIKTAATDHAMVVGGVGVGIACVLLFGMIFSFILCMTIQ